MNRIKKTDELYKEVFELAQEGLSNKEIAYVTKKLTRTSAGSENCKGNLIPEGGCFNF